MTEQGLESAIREARRADAAGAGRDGAGILALYITAIQKTELILAAVDVDKMDNIRKFRWAYLIKSQLVGFLLGVGASILASILASIILSKCE